MRNFNLNFLPHPKTTEMLLLSNLQHLARGIFILKTQALTQQIHQCPETNLQKTSNEAYSRHKREASPKTASSFLTLLGTPYFIQGMR